MTDRPATPPLPGAPLPLVSSAAAGHGPNAPARLRHVAEQFKSVFLAEMMGPMFEGIDTDGLGGGGVGEEMFRPMLVEQYANAIAHGGGVGVANSITRELVRMQANQDEAAETPDGAGS